MRRVLFFVLTMLMPAAAVARPLYFENLTAMFGIQEGDRLHACGVCHERWKGTGPRNPFGTLVEQQLYVGKSIRDAITAVLPADADGDGTSNGDELTVFHTLPGYGCDNFDIAVDPPVDFHSVLVPNVPTCLEPQDIRLSRPAIGYTTRVGTEDTETLTIFNNGSQLPITVASYAPAAGSAASFQVTGPPVPIVMPVGGSVDLTVAFHPTSTGLQNATVRIVSDDPDEATLDVAVTGVGFVRPVAPAADRAACLTDVERALERYTKIHLAEWRRCWLDELRGVACDTGARDRRLARARARLRLAVGGKRDKHCAKKMLTPARLGMQNVCGGSCGALRLMSLADLTECLECRQAEATDAVLAAAVGSAPPDRPANRPDSAAFDCNESLLDAMEKAIPRVQQLMAGCALDNVTAATPTDCAASLADAVAQELAPIDAARTACTDTSGLAACPFVGKKPDPACLATATSKAAGDLVDAVFPRD